MKTLYVLILLIISTVASAQDSNKINIGTEQDVLPYLTGGYYGAAWIGKDQFRIRALTARVKKPDLLVPDGFHNNWVTAYALLGEYFLKENWKGWSGSCGFVYWKNSIEAEGGTDQKNYNTYLLNGSISYTFTLYKHLYLSPWAGMHVRVGGPKEVNVDGQSFNQPLLNPEASVKVGVYF